ncbi:hypothetical protein [Bdellovibrio sp. HCB-162]|uniref:hypothetical protein n=1 Tax=Bdellovibrio sp. HCB-162 TaxID=3394234 RepID=UPI0039BD45B4
MEEKIKERRNKKQFSHLPSFPAQEERKTASAVSTTASVLHCVIAFSKVYPPTSFITFVLFCPVGSEQVFKFTLRP